ncbi:PKD domain-containing protein [Polaribacter sp. Z014]|uniref:PKD domain-containing protein n=1 Tax=Polaribacter sp. Z014 TaxID=2927126 RepID=UPI0024C2C861|nr:PKD domain-containing protein [Polaribacter sp. Z014]
MIYKLIKKINKSIFIIPFILLGLVSCVDNGYEAFVPPTGNVNNIQPSTLFTTSTSADDNMSIVFRSYSTDAASYLWDFGDGTTSEEANPDYKYTIGGKYNVKLTTTSSDGLKAIDSVIVSPISVDFNFSNIDSKVTFENLTSGAKSLVWYFGDGETLTWDSEKDTELDPSFNPSHIYKTADTFGATLTATNFLDVQVSVSKNIEGLVLSTVPDFTFDVNGLTVQFTDASLLATTHTWDFGDGTTSTEVSPMHTFPAEATYDVTLTTTNEAGVSKSETKAVPVGAVKPTFKAIVQNGTADDFQGETGDNADAWDMTPNSKVKLDADNGVESDSPYRALWNNSDLNSYIDTAFGTNEQPGSSSDGSYVNGEKTRSVKLANDSRRLYQLVKVEAGVVYSFTIDTRSEAEGINTEVFILNNEITSEEDINTDPANNSNVDAYLNITNDYNSSKGSASDNTFTTSTFTFKATSNIVVIYARALKAVDKNNEVFIDNIDIITPGF